LFQPYSLFLLLGDDLSSLGNLHFLVHSPLSMLRNRLHLGNRTDLCAERRLSDLILNFFRLLLVFKVALAPVTETDIRVVFSNPVCTISVILLLGLDLSELLLSLCSLDTSHFFVFLLGILVNLSRSLVTSLSHFLPHDLAEGAVASAICEESLWLFSSNCLCFLLKTVNIWLLESSSWLGLPLYSV
jgi:hypothetical protein